MIEMNSDRVLSLFQGTLAWFSSSVSADLKIKWEQYGGQITASLDEANYIFSSDPATEDTKSAFANIRGSGVLLFKPKWIEFAIKWSTTTHLKTPGIERFILLPEYVCEELRRMEVSSVGVGKEELTKELIAFKTELVRRISSSPLKSARRCSRKSTPLVNDNNLLHSTLLEYPGESFSCDNIHPDTDPSTRICDGSNKNKLHNSHKCFLAASTSSQCSNTRSLDLKKCSVVVEDCCSVKEHGQQQLETIQQGQQLEHKQVQKHQQHQHLLKQQQQKHQPEPQQGMPQRLQQKQHQQQQQRKEEEKQQRRQLQQQQEKTRKQENQQHQKQQQPRQQQLQQRCTHQKQCSKQNQKKNSGQQKQKQHQCELKSPEQLNGQVDFQINGKTIAKGKINEEAVPSDGCEDFLRCKARNNGIGIAPAHNNLCSLDKDVNEEDLSHNNSTTAKACVDYFTPRQKKEPCSTALQQRLTNTDVTPLSTKKRRKLYTQVDVEQFASSAHLENVANTPRHRRLSLEEQLTPIDIHEILNLRREETPLSEKQRSQRQKKGPHQSRLRIETSPMLSTKKGLKKSRREAMLKHKQMMEVKRAGQEPGEEFQYGFLHGYTHIDYLDIPTDMLLEDFIINNSGCRVELVRS